MTPRPCTTCLWWAAFQTPKGLIRTTCRVCDEEAASDE